jgi:DNA-binding PadR family transcriptional regulator
MTSLPNSQPNATAAALLGLLHSGPMTGGQLVAAAAERFGLYFSVTRSQVYRELPVLCEAGLLRLGEQGPRSSRRYAITAAGKRAFRTWLLAGDGGADQLRSPLILRLRHAGSLTARQRRVLVAQGRALYEERLAVAREAVTAAMSGRRVDPYGRAVAEFAVAHAEAMLDLLDAIPT